MSYCSWLFEIKAIFILPQRSLLWFCVILVKKWKLVNVIGFLFSLLLHTLSWISNTTSKIQIVWSHSGMNGQQHCQTFWQNVTPILRPPLKTVILLLEIFFHKMEWSWNRGAFLVLIKAFPVRFTTSRETGCLYYGIVLVNTLWKKPTATRSRWRRLLRNSLPTSAEVSGHTGNCPCFQFLKLKPTGNRCCLTKVSGNTENLGFLLHGANKKLATRWGWRYRQDLLISGDASWKNMQYLYRLIEN